MSEAVERIQALRRRHQQRQAQAKRPTAEALATHFPERDAEIRESAQKIGVTGVAVAYNPPIDCIAFVDRNGVEHAIDLPLVTKRDCIAWWKK